MKKVLLSLMLSVFLISCDLYEDSSNCDCGEVTKVYGFDSLTGLDLDTPCGSKYLSNTQVDYGRDYGVGDYVCKTTYTGPSGPSDGAY